MITVCFTVGVCTHLMGVCTHLMGVCTHLMGVCTHLMGVCTHLIRLIVWWGMLHCGRLHSPDGRLHSPDGRLHSPDGRLHSPDQANCLVGHSLTNLTLIILFLTTSEMALSSTLLTTLSFSTFSWRFIKLSSCACCVANFRSRC